MEGSLEQHGRGRPDHLPGRRDAQAPAAVQDGLRDAPRVHDGAKVALLVAGTAQKGDRLGGHRQGERADEQGERHPEREPAACRCALSWLWRHDALGAPRDALRRRRTGGGSARGRGALDACAGACASHYRRGGAFSADSIASILGNIAPPPQVQPLSLNAVLAPDAAQALVDGEMERRLAEHLPQGGAVAESVRETLATPQISQAAARLTEALHTGDAAGLVMELGLNPNYGGLGVEPFLRALQEATPKPSDDAAGGSEEEKPDDKDGPAPMEE
mmetsp:Transcript_22591/g.74503  ORF Transcript_22591/g.74503 Transcript_22591/m.74503 type:complete len:275 (+) Transcript_22591:273-1097(+)